MSDLEPEVPVDDPVDEALPADAPPADPAPVAPEPVAPAQVNWDDMNVLSEAAARLQALGYDLVQAAQPDPASEPTLPEYDPYNPDAYFAAREAQLEARLLERFGPVESFVQSEADQRAETHIGSQIDTMKGELDYKDGDTREIRAFADLIAPEMIRQYGQNERAGQAAIRAAVEHFKTRDAARDAAAVERYKESLKNPSDSTPYEPGVRQIGRPDETAFLSEADVARSFRERYPV